MTKTKAGPEKVPRVVESPSGTCRPRQNGRTIPIGHADELVSRHAGACAYQSVESIAAFRRINRVSVCGKRDGLCRIELAGVKADDIVRLRIGRPIALPPEAKLEAKPPRSFPGIVNIRFDVRESEVPDGVVRCLGVRLKISKQGVREGRARRVCRAGVEGDLTVVSVPAVLICAVAGHQDSCLERW